MKTYSSFSLTRQSHAHTVKQYVVICLVRSWFLSKQQNTNTYSRCRWPLKLNQGGCLLVVWSSNSSAVASRNIDLTQTRKLISLNYCLSLQCIYFCSSVSIGKTVHVCGLACVCVWGQRSTMHGILQEPWLLFFGTGPHWDRGWRGVTE